MMTGVGVREESKFLVLTGRVGSSFTRMKTTVGAPHFRKES